MMQIEIKKVKLTEIKLNPDNPRRIGKVEMDRLVKSLQDFPDMLSIREIVVDETMTILGGNMRYLALKKAGAKECTAKIVSGLTPEQKREFIIKDNSAFGEWDMDLLSSSWSDLPLVEWGVDLPEDWLGGDKADPADAEPQIDKAEELNKVWRVTLGDLWQIGEHRLLCGDSTKKEDVGRVMGEEKAQMVFTDPPYGVDYDGGTTKRKKLEGDTGTTLYAPCCLMARDFSDDKAPLYLWHAGVKGIAAAAAAAAAAAGYEIRCELVWNKNLAQFGALSAQYKQKHEPAYYCFKKGKPPRWFGPTNEVTVWDVDRSQVNEFHPTQKPIDLAIRAMKNSTEPGDIIADWFGGSGATMVAAENMNRKCRMVELDVLFIATILQRMTDAFPNIEIKRLP